MARQNYITGKRRTIRAAEAIIRLCAAPPKSIRGYAQAWALMAVGHVKLRSVAGRQVDDGMAAAERALALEPELAEAHAIKARILLQDGDAGCGGRGSRDRAEAGPGILRGQPFGGALSYQLHRHEDAIRYYEKASEADGCRCQFGNDAGQLLHRPRRCRRQADAPRNWRSSARRPSSPRTSTTPASPRTARTRSRRWEREIAQRRAWSARC